ncbi:MAG: hypothetical protein OEV01_16375, partial [Nitrospira sp.]|nr:hypothetical protein [Nitrospira sp.]
LAATSSIEQRMTEYLRKQSISSLKEAVDIAIRTWAVGDRAQRQADEAKGDHEDAMENSDQPAADAQTLLAHVHQCMIDRSIECVLLDRQVAGTSKYRTLGTDELRALLPKDLSSAVT